MSRETLLDLQRRWARLRGPRRAAPTWERVQPPLAKGASCSAWPERVAVVPPDEAGAALPLEPVGAGAPLARFLDQKGRPAAWAAVESDGLALDSRPGEGPLWVQLVHEGFQYPAPGASEYELGPSGLAARVLREAHSFEVLLVNEGAKAATFQVEPGAPWLDLDSTSVAVGPAQGVPLRGRVRAGSSPKPGSYAEILLKVGNRRLRAIVEVGPWAPRARLRVHCVPEDLGVVARDPVQLQVHLSSDVPLRGMLHLGLLPHPVVREFVLQPGIVHQDTFMVAPETLPRVEKGSFRVLAVSDAARPEERMVKAEVQFRRLKLRRNVPRVRLAPSRTNPYPHVEVSLRRSDGGETELAWTCSPGLEPALQVRPSGEGRLLVWCQAPPEAPLEGEIVVREGGTGLVETIPVRLEGRSR